MPLLWGILPVMPLKTGALSRAEIQSVWEGSVDKGYRDPLVRAGEGNGFEAWTQLFTQFERASKAIDVTTQAMFITDWSGASNPPAKGGQKATVTLTLTRTKRLSDPLYLQAGLFVVDEQTTDSGSPRGVVVNTGRRYFLAEDVFFAPGEQGPFSAVFEAERFGYGYNNPRANTITAIEQKGSLFENDHLTITVSDQITDLTGGLHAKVRAIGANDPDMFVPDHLGQYIQVVTSAGQNTGLNGRMIAFDSPTPPTYGSAMELEIMYVVGVDTVTGTFAKDELILINAQVAGRVVDVSTVSGRLRLSFIYLNGGRVNIIPTATIVGPHGTATIRSMDFSSTFDNEAPSFGVGGVSWRVLDWIQDWGLSATNALSPANGRSPFLDELGSERAIGRSPGESDDSYAARIRAIADVVTPNAIRRAINRSIPGLAWCLREVGMEGLPGFFFDGTNEPPAATPHGAANDAYDMDTVTFVGAYTSGTFRSERIVLEDPTTFVRYFDGWFGRDVGGTQITIIRKWGKLPTVFGTIRLRGLDSGALFNVVGMTEHTQNVPKRYFDWLNYEQFRAFFLVTMPGIAYGEFGFPYDNGGYLNNGYDMPPGFEVAYDGYARGAADVYRRIYNSIEAARAGGVGWELRIDPGPCP